MSESIKGGFGWKDSVDVKTSQNKVVKTTILKTKEGEKTTKLVNTDIIDQFLHGVTINSELWKQEVTAWENLYKNEPEKFYSQLANSTEEEWKAEPEKWSALVHFVNMMVSRKL